MVHRHLLAGCECLHRRCGRVNMSDLLVCARADHQETVIGRDNPSGGHERKLIPNPIPFNTTRSNTLGFQLSVARRVETVAEGDWVSSRCPPWERLFVLRLAVSMVQRPVPLSSLERSRPPPGQCPGFVGNRRPCLPLSGVIGPATQTAGLRIQ